MVMIQIDQIMNDRHNTISRQEYQLLQTNLKQLFVDTNLMKYRIEFILNCVGVIHMGIV